MRLTKYLAEHRSMEMPRKMEAIKKGIWFNVYFNNFTGPGQLYGKIHGLLDEYLFLTFNRVHPELKEKLNEINNRNRRT